MNELEIAAYNRAAHVCQKVVEEFATEYVHKNGGNDAAKAAGWAILQAVVKLREVPIAVTPNDKLCGERSESERTTG